MRSATRRFTSESSITSTRGASSATRETGADRGARGSGATSRRRASGFRVTSAANRSYSCDWRGGDDRSGQAPSAWQAMTAPVLSWTTGGASPPLRRPNVKSACAPRPHHAATSGARPQTSRLGPKPRRDGPRRRCLRWRRRPHPNRPAARCRADAADRVSVDNQHAQTRGYFAQAGFRPVRRPLLRRTVNQNVLPSPGCGGCANLAFPGIHQALANCQSKTGAAVSARDRAVGLSERLE